VRDIVSAINPTLKLLRAVLSGRGVRKHQRALLAGARPILEVVRDFPERSLAWVTQGTTPAPPGDAPESLAWYRMSPALFKEVDVSGTGGPLLLIDAPALEAWDDAAWPDGCTLFLPFQDPENVGAALRTAAGFGVAQVVLLREAANPFHPRSVRAAGSALLRVSMRRGPSIHDFEPHGAPIFALSPVGQDVGECRFPARFGLLVGLEGPGLPERWRTESPLAVPMAPGTESLNAAAATAVVLYLWSRERGATGNGGL
jgi:16S rRNA (guanine527-N7)-methyltransferase